ncbi:hypothetical protein F9K85_01565 [Brucella tritici]|uniref:hypothetical protein n=1 Tax=Brucella tritici TaxID=94626 RepID=UPI00124E8BCF|nr:hypothetical protein [Brucella tritici]KAB2679634.1 hypothetical protein F9K85_01565 [Brucella tritici]
MTEQTIPADAEGLSKDKRIIAAFAALDLDVHDLGNVAGVALEYFDNFDRDGNTTGRGFATFRLTHDQINHFHFLLRESAARAKKLHDAYFAAMQGGQP